MPRSDRPAATRKPHPSELADARKIAGAVRFTAHLRLGPDETITEDHATAAEALAAAERLGRERGRYGRRACAYAVTREGFTVHLTAGLARMAGLI